MKVQRDHLRGHAEAIPHSLQKTDLLLLANKFDERIQALLDAPRRPFAVYAEALTSR